MSPQRLPLENPKEEIKENKMNTDKKENGFWVFSYLFMN